jgi:endonuclease/exonuclease/phosphatase family metal-dependent hydrolase
MEVVHGATIDRAPDGGGSSDGGDAGDLRTGTPAARRRYGNALLSAHPVSSWQAVRLPTNPRREARGLVDAVVLVDGRPVRVGVTHLQNRSARERREQAAHLVGLLADGDGPGRRLPTILLGDMNAGPDSAEMRALTAVLTDAWAAVGDGPGHTFPALRPIARIDHVLVSADVRPEAAAVVATRASDHRPLVVDVDLPDEAPLFA